MKSKLLIMVVAICLLISNFTMVMAQTIDSDNIDSIKANVQSCNITFERNTSNTIDINYYGTASNLNYDLKTSINENILNIDIVYIGEGIAPIIKDGGVVVKLPYKDFESLDIAGSKGSGITLNNIDIDTNLKTESCAVFITNYKSEKDITIDSEHDAYNIKSVPLTKDFNLKANGSTIKFKFSQIPDNLHFKVTDENSYFEIPQDWTYDYSIGSGEPDMVIDTVESDFRLTYAVQQTIDCDNIKSIETDVQGCNVTFERSTSNVFEFDYYGTASCLNYDLKTSVNEDILSIDLDYIGEGMAPFKYVGGIVVKVPDKEFVSLDITGRECSGITLNNIGIDTNLKTESCSVEIKDEQPENKFFIDSKHDVYILKLAPLTKKFDMKAECCVIKFEFSKAPDNLNFKLNDSYGSINIPENWSYDYSIGSGKPNMTIETVYSVLKLSC